MPVRQLIRRLIYSPGLSMGSSRLVVAMLGMLATPLYSRVLAPSEYGTLSLSIAVAAAASTAPTQWLTGSVLRFGPESEPKNLKTQIARGLALSAAPSAIVAGGLGFVVFGNEPVLLTLLVVYSLTEATYITLWVASRAKLSLRTYITGGILRNLIALILVLGFERIVPVDAQIVLLCMLVSSSVAAVSLLWTKRWTEGTGSQPLTLPAWLKYGWPLIINYAFTYGLMYMDRFIVAMYHGRATAGVYGATYDLLYAMVTLPTALAGLALVPQLFGTASSTDRKTMLRRLRKQVVACALTVLVALLVLWPYISRLLIGAQVRNDSLWVAAGLALTFTIASVRYQYLNIVLQLELKTKLLTVVTGSALILNVVLNLALVPKYEIAGAVTATLITSILATAGAGFLARSGRKSTLPSNSATRVK